jgi:hypothetical protein
MKAVSHTNHALHETFYTKYSKQLNPSWALWYMVRIPATWEVETGMIRVRGQSTQNVSEIPSQ